MANRIGQQLDNYRLTRLLGAGGFGEVYLAEHLYRTTQVAIKLLPQLAQDDLHSFLIEARTFRLKHPNIVQVLDFGVEGRIPFIVMEYAPNGTLRQRHPKGTRVLLPTIVSYVKQVASALQYAHDERLVHRDVKPENMLIGVQNQVLLSDFGIATIAHGTASQSVEAMAGTIPYMAPEQIQGHPRSASDQYSLGVVVYGWLCGDNPFHGTLTEVAVQHATMPPPSLREKVSTISPDVEQVVTTALAKDPKQRFGSVLAFATALEQASQVKRPEPEPEPVVPVSETTDINQSQQSTVMATPVPVIPSSQQMIVSEVPADTSAQPQTILPLSGKERLRQAEEERRQTGEERARQEKEQADKLEEERVRKAEEAVLVATELATSANQTPLPTEVARSSKPPELQPDTRVAVKPAKPGSSRRFVLIGLAGLVIVALASGITWLTVHHATPTGGSHAYLAGSITEFPVPTSGSGPWGITAGPGGNLWFAEYNGNKIGRISPSGTITEFPVPTAGSDPDGITAGPGGNLWFTEYNGNKIGRISPSGTITEFPVPTAKSGPDGITAGPDGNLWFTEYNGNKIGHISPSGTITEFPVPTAKSSPTWITAGPGGNLWFAEYSGNKIGRITSGK
jgi:serine/threonine protein kinase/sugar lactone lactonase YvrE